MQFYFSDRINRMDRIWQYENKNNPDNPVNPVKINEVSYKRCQPSGSD
jgi:hypothetical protein